MTCFSNKQSVTHYEDPKAQHICCHNLLFSSHLPRLSLLLACCRYDPTCDPATCKGPYMPDEYAAQGTYLIEAKLKSARVARRDLPRNPPGLECKAKIPPSESRARKIFHRMTSTSDRRSLRRRLPSCKYIRHVPQINDTAVLHSGLNLVNDNESMAFRILH